MLLALTPTYELTVDSVQAVVEARRIGTQNYLPIKSLVNALDVTYVFDPQTQRHTLSANGHSVALIGDVSVIRCDSAYRNLSFGPRTLGNDTYFPAEELTASVGVALEKLVFVKEVKDVPAIHRLTLAARGDSTVLSFGWERPVDFDVRLVQDQAIIEIDGRWTGRQTPQPAGGVTKVVLTPLVTYTRLELEMKGVNAVIERDSETVLFKKITTRIAAIVIDPGHGGIDPGAVGKKGLYEKDANLDISTHLQALLRDSLGVNTMVTRDKDIYLSLKERTDMANRTSADLFISVHCNAAPRNSKARGFETYFLSEAKTDEARAAAALENAALEFDGIEQPKDDVNFILYDLAQSAYLEESNCLAEFIQSAAEDKLDIPARGVNQAGFYVLRGAFMPAVLVECAFVSNLEEEKLLKEKDFRRKLAYTIFCGIRDFVVDYERRMNN